MNPPDHMSVLAFNLGQSDTPPVRCYGYTYWSSVSMGWILCVPSCVVSFALGESECQLQNASTWHLLLAIKNVYSVGLVNSELTPKKVFPVTRNWRKPHTTYQILPVKYHIQNHISLFANSLMWSSPPPLCSLEFYSFCRLPLKRNPQKPHTNLLNT